MLYADLKTLHFSYKKDLMEEKFFLSVENRKICGVLHLPSQDAPPCVITCHGLFSSKDSDKFIAVADCFTKEGLAVIRFDFGGCGESSGDFSDTTVSRRLQELEAVLKFSCNHPKLHNKPGILGSSLGGYVAAVCSAKHDVAALSLWATPCALAELSQNIPAQDLKRLKKNFFDDALKYSLSSLLGKMSCVQIIHGTEDTIVPQKHAEEIFSLVKDPKELVLLSGADHSISGQHSREKALQKSRDWFKEHF